MTKRLFPKCFKSNIDAISFHDMITEKYPQYQQTKDFQQLCKHYTSLLCGIHFLQNGGDKEKIRIRFQRFLLLHYYPECRWELIFQTYLRAMKQFSLALWNNMSEEDQLACQAHQNKLEEEILQYFESVLSTETEKLKLV